MEMHHPAVTALQGVGWIIVTRKVAANSLLFWESLVPAAPGDRPPPCTHLLSPKPAACRESKWD